MDDEPMTEQAADARRPMDIAMAVLADRDRRRVLVSLLDTGPQSRSTPLHLQDLRQSGEEAETFEIRMCHVHLPKLADTGYVEWDKDTNEIRDGPHFDDLRPLLRILVENGDELPGDVI